MGRTLPVWLVRRRLCSAQLGMYSTECQRLWLNVLFVNDSGCYWYWTITQILSLVQVPGDAACLIWSRCPKPMCRKSFGIDWYTWRNPVTMWMCIGVVRFQSHKIWILNRIKLWKIRKNPSRVVVRLSSPPYWNTDCPQSDIQCWMSQSVNSRHESYWLRDWNRSSHSENLQHGCNQ